MTDKQHQPSPPEAAAIRKSFEDNGYYLARGVYSPVEVGELESDFDRIVEQLNASGEEINARWGGELMAKLDAQETVVLHTHQVQMFSSRWLRAFMQERFLDV